MNLPAELLPTSTLFPTDLDEALELAKAAAELTPQEMEIAASIIREYVEEGDITLADNETIDELPRVQKAQRVFSDAIDEWADALGCWVRKMEERYE